MKYTTMGDGGQTYKHAHGETDRSETETDRNKEDTGNPRHRAKTVTSMPEFPVDAS